LINKIRSDLININKIIKLEFFKISYKKYRKNNNINNFNKINNLYEILKNSKDKNNHQKNKYLLYLLLTTTDIDYNIIEIIFNSILLKLINNDYYYLIKIYKNNIDMSFDDFLSSFDNLFKKKIISNINDCYELNIIDIVPLDYSIVKNFLSKIKYEI